MRIKTMSKINNSYSKTSYKLFNTIKILKYEMPITYSTVLFTDQDENYQDKKLVELNVR